MKKEPELVPIPTNPNVMRFEVELKNGTLLRVQTMRMKSGASKYGNQTAVEVDVNFKWFQTFDTRYDHEMDTIEGYQEYFTKWVEDTWKENAKKITRIM